ncbi:MAG: type II toxin-antitoxin system VapC family toxin [Gemmatimonadota bacterium]
MALILADTDVLIDALNGLEPATGRVARELRAGALATTTVTVFELLSGVGTEAEKETVRKLLTPIRVFSFDEAAARSAAEIRRDLEKKGRAIDMADYLIAGIAASGSATLITRNRAHFERVPGLRVESP